MLRGFAETHYVAKSWNKERRVVARIEASASHADDMLRRGIDIRYIVTSLQGNDAEAEAARRAINAQENS